MNANRFPHRFFVVLLAALLPASAIPAQNVASDATIAGAIEAAERGDADAAKYAALAGHPLYGWIEYASLRRDIDRLSIAGGEGFLERYRGRAVAEAFRSILLPALSPRKEWRAYNAYWSPAIQSQE